MCSGKVDASCIEAVSSSIWLSWVQFPILRPLLHVGLPLLSAHFRSRNQSIKAILVPDRKIKIEKEMILCVTMSSELAEISQTRVYINRNWCGLQWLQLKGMALISHSCIWSSPNWLYSIAWLLHNLNQLLSQSKTSEISSD